MTNDAIKREKGSVIQAHRQEKKVSRDKLARLTGLTAATIFRIEKGKQGVGPTAAKALARELGLDLSWLLST